MSPQAESEVYHQLRAHRFIVLPALFQPDWLLQGLGDLFQHHRNVCPLGPHVLRPPGFVKLYRVFHALSLQKVQYAVPCRV